MVKSSAQIIGVEGFYSYTGGIAGQILYTDGGNYSRIINCTNHANVTGGLIEVNHVGGLIGVSAGIILHSSLNTGNVNGHIFHTGGLAGGNFGHIYSCCTNNGLVNGLPLIQTTKSAQETQLSLALMDIQNGNNPTTKKMKRMIKKQTLSNKTRAVVCRASQASRRNRSTSGAFIFLCVIVKDNQKISSYPRKNIIRGESNKMHYIRYLYMKLLG